MVSFSNDNDRWAAVVRRDRRADGTFYYSVLTTGVYCRPSCPSRLARQENVSFHGSCEAAEKAGFRPCKRCRPNEPPLVERRAVAVTKACRLIEEAEEMPNLDALAKAVGMSRFHFHRIFKIVTGVTPKAYGATLRVQRSRNELLLRSTVTEPVPSVGFNSSRHLYANSSEAPGTTLTRFRFGGGGELIRFAVGQCSLGSVLVASTEKGVCAIWFGDDPGALVRDLRPRFPKTELIGGDRDFEQQVAKVVGFVETPARGFDLPLDIRGTAFQQRVWRALREIPAGSTRSYAEIAKRIDAPKAIRAVVQACLSNTIAVAIPCHRVVRTDGALSGYRWGVERKRALLEREASP